jgi:hypothetical protein
MTATDITVLRYIHHFDVLNYRIVFSSIMPSGAEKWFKFLKNFNKLIDQKVIAEEKEKQLAWVDGVVKSVQGNFSGNPITLRINLQDLLKTNVALVKNFDESSLIDAEAVSAELLDLSKSVRTHYMSSVSAAIAALRDEAMSVVGKITAALFGLSEAALFQVTTQGFVPRLVGCERDRGEVLLGLTLSGPMVAGNRAALDLWIQRLFQALRSVLAHFLTGKSFNEKLFTEYNTCIAMAGLSPAEAAVVQLVSDIKAASAVTPVSLDERDITAQLAAFDDSFMKQYCVRAAQEICSKFDPRKVLQDALLCELNFSNASLWEAEIAVTDEAAPAPGELFELGVKVEKINVTQIYPPPPPEPEPEPELEGSPDQESEPPATEQEAAWEADQA